MDRRPVLAVISGGGCRQIECATGCLLAIEEAGITVDRYRGSSAGAAVGALAASGLRAQAISDLICTTPVDSLFRPSYFRQLGSFVPGVRVDNVYDNSGMFDFLTKHVTDDARKRCRVTVTRLRDYAPCMCDATPVTTLASAAIPEIFRPVEINGELYVDGGVKNLIPTPKLATIRDYRHIYILICNDDSGEWHPWTRFGRAIKAFYATLDREYCQIVNSGWDELGNVTVIKPSPFRSSLLDWSDGHRLIDHAYIYTRSLLLERGRGGK